MSNSRAWDPWTSDDPVDLERPLRLSPWRGYVRIHFARPKPGLFAVFVGTTALILSLAPHLLALLYVVVFWTTRSGEDSDLGEAMELYNSALLIVPLALAGNLILVIPVLTRVLRVWVLLPGTLLTAASLYNAFFAPSPFG